MLAPGSSKQIVAWWIQVLLHYLEMLVAAATLVVSVDSHLVKLASEDLVCRCLHRHHLEAVHWMTAVGSVQA